jgi:hypothetical protein
MNKLKIFSPLLLILIPKFIPKQTFFKAFTTNQILHEENKKNEKNDIIDKIKTSESVKKEKQNQKKKKVKVNKQSKILESNDDEILSFDNYYEQCPVCCTDLRTSNARCNFCIENFYFPQGFSKERK